MRTSPPCRPALAATILGGPGADRLTAGPAGDELSGGDGNDALAGGDGDDSVDGGVGADELDGGPGADRILVRDGIADVVGCGEGLTRSRPTPSIRWRPTARA